MRRRSILHKPVWVANSQRQCSRPPQELYGEASSDAINRASFRDDNDFTVGQRVVVLTSQQDFVWGKVRSCEDASVTVQVNRTHIVKLERPKVRRTPERASTGNQGWPGWIVLATACSNSSDSHVQQPAGTTRQVGVVGRSSGREKVGKGHSVRAGRTRVGGDTVDGRV